MNGSWTSGRAVVAAGFVRVSRRASLLAAVAPLALYAGPASAFQLGCGIEGCATQSGLVTQNGDVYDYTYDFNAGSDNINQIEIPEIKAGEFISSEGVYAGLIPSGWDIAEQTTGALSDLNGSYFTDVVGSPAAFLEITANGGEGPLWTGGSGDTFTLTLESPYGTSVGTNFFSSVGLGGEGMVMPAVAGPPDPLTPLPSPEPATLALLGSAVAGLAGLRRRRRR